MTKRNLFQIALRVARDNNEEIHTARAFADSLGVSEVHLYNVLDDKSTSARVSEAIDSFIEAKMRPLRNHLNALAA